jgi:hypothetical protein
VAVLDLTRIADHLQQFNRDVIGIANAPNTESYPGSLAGIQYPLVLSVPGDFALRGTSRTSRTLLQEWQILVFIAKVPDIVVGTDAQDNIALIAMDLESRFLEQYSRSENITVVESPHTAVSAEGATVEGPGYGILRYAGTQAYGLQLSIMTLTNW